MKKKVCILLAFLLLLGSVMPISAKAATSRAMSIAPGLSFSGTTAYCEVTVCTDYVTSEIDATMKLWNGSTCIATWTASDTGILGMNKTKTVTKGVTYTLTVDVTINGVAEDRVSISRTCS